MFLLNRLIEHGRHDSSKQFTSHYVPIKSGRGCQMRYAPHLFTSHYVPIKSLSVDVDRPSTIEFTSHYVPIKSNLSKMAIFSMKNLHPIMFLLNRILKDKLSITEKIFTSHYVPIKSHTF